MILYIFELAFQDRKACSNQRPRILDMTFLVKFVRWKNIGVWMEFRRHCRLGSREFLFIDLVRMGLQMRLQTRLSGKIEFFERPDGLSSCLNGGTFDHQFAYQITPIRTYIYDLHWMSPYFPFSYGLDCMQIWEICDAAKYYISGMVNAKCSHVPKIWRTQGNTLYLLNTWYFLSLVYYYRCTTMHTQYDANLHQHYSWHHLQDFFLDWLLL